ncbi:T9SS type B sorting domain-containing protein [Aquimarina sp. RZ0]|uniref:T9SS type B sorting domain-containing protein n=1 Tax=Aquimarina sp. RZ0 TaxID=2607730 RepID=UPI0011F09ECF|nr:T9SS type B sorting domain-containing protein [Aquimarina sp. RZ0]KAA1246720.1 T9SS type B sorting domain-containing protein [Aquimarina sp. RZ0]
MSANLGIAQGSVCADNIGDTGADPFCSSTGILFPNCNLVNNDCTTSSEMGPNYGCLISQPFPAWYFLQIDENGLLGFTIRQTANADGTGMPLDVDFICYGPFDDPVTPCVSELTSASIVDCSFLSDFTETMTIPNAVSGEYYLVLITNYSQQPGFISFEQTVGSGSTDCSILDAFLGPNQNICGFTPVSLNGASDGAIRYEWSVFNEETMLFDTIAGETNPLYTVTVSGRYQILIEDIEGNTETDEVVITFNSPPVVENSPLDITLCELSSDTAEFDFTANTSLILGTQDPDQFVVTYYTSQLDAENKENSISEVYTTIAGEVFARIENVNLNSCYLTTSFNLLVNPSPNLSNSTYSYTICEISDGSQDQGTFVFSDVLGSLTNANGESVGLLANDELLSIYDFSITFHNSETDARNDENPITNGSQVAAGDIIFVRVENNQTSNPTACFNIDNIARIYIEIGQIPEANTEVPDLVQCAISLENQHVAFFDLTSNNTVISGSNNSPESQVIYYASLQDFENDLPIADTRAYSNISNPQTVIAVIIDPDSGCERSTSTSFDIQVEALPVLVNNEAFSGSVDVCVFADGIVQGITMIGEDIGAVDGQEYRYDWTPDNIDSDNDGNEDAIYFIDELLQEQVFNLVITRIASSGGGTDCSNAINPITSEPYKITLKPILGLVGVDYEVVEPSFSTTEYTIVAIPELPIGDLSDLEYALQSMSSSNFLEYQNSPVFTNVSAGDYKILVRNKKGCLPEATSERIRLIGFQKYFTPNGDGMHDTWNLINMENQIRTLIYIFDRNGRLLKQLIPGERGWDGTYNGKLLPSSEYWFRVEFNEPKNLNTTQSIFSGSFSLIR